MLKKLFVLLVPIALVSACDSSVDNFRFVYVDSLDSGLDFQNTITENDSINIVRFQYCYNGGGVGIGDFDKNGLPDIVLTGNQVSSAIYLNQGDLKFKDISEKANFKTSGWITGVSITDINADGWDDIYLNVGGANCENNCPNLLFVNQGVGSDGLPKFEEQAGIYGLDDSNYSQQSVFFDFDGDGDLDVYILRNGNSGIDKNNPVPKQYMPPHLKDVLLLNNTEPDTDHPVFTDISKNVGIVHGGFGLGLGINDFNGDGLIDIYVANDFITDDLLYIQQKHRDSTMSWFEDRAKAYLGHATYNSMGMDFNDVDNDALPDILVVDMLPKTYERQKKMLGITNYEKYLLSQRNGYSAQYVHNTLQINNGTLEEHTLKTSEVGFVKGLASTDWSWAPLMIDLDNDADKDIYISNGYVKDVSDLDYINYSSKNNMFGSTEERLEKQIGFTKQLDSIYLTNFIFENDGNTNFNDVSTGWIKDRPSYSNGVAYADLDLDGDLDLVVNNINEKAFLLENKTSNDPTKHYLRIKLEGGKKNPYAIGAKVALWSQGSRQHHFQSRIRGYLSSVEPIVHFGVSGETVDSLQVIWPNGMETLVKKVTVDQVLDLNINDATEKRTNTISGQERLFVAKEGLLDYVHEENEFNEYSGQHLLMRQYSQSGPCIVTGDIDGRPGDEIFIGGSKGKPGQIWFQNANGTYEVKQELDGEYEDTDACLVDIDGDNDLDLYVTSGSTEFEIGSDFYQDRLYLNDGSGNFQYASAQLPEVSTSSHIVRPSDIDHDGDIDFFIGSRNVPGRYPEIPESKILINDRNTFVAAVDPILKDIGMVTDALWADIDKDGWDDLILVGEWMPITILKNYQGKLTPMNTKWVNENMDPTRTEGWWNCIEQGDFDNDGDIDFLVGNQGLNGFMQPEQNRPIYVYKGDFDKNGTPDPVLAKYYDTENGTELLPVHTRDDIMAQLVVLKKKYLDYKAFAKVDFESLLNIKNLDEETLPAYTFESSYLENLGDGNFKVTVLPEICQNAPINDILVRDFNTDGILDALLVGNDFSAEMLYGKFDAMNGLLLSGKKDGFDVISSRASGFYVPGQSNHLVELKDATGNRYSIATQNNENVKVFSRK